MGRRRVNPNLVKVNRTYIVAELAKLLSVHKNTVANWHRDELEAIDDGRPKLFQGSVVRAFLIRRNASRKRPCRPGTLFCLKCRQPRQPARGWVEYHPLTPISGNLRANCSSCETTMHRQVCLTDLAAVMPGLSIQSTEALSRLSGRPSPSLNCDLERQAVG
jgi:hypothetical protein